MLLNLSEVVFDNDFFSIDTPDGNTLILNKIQESLKISDNTDETVDIQNINIEIVLEDEFYVRCPCVIGLGNEYIKINTNHLEYEGEVLTSDNMKYCTIEVYELSVS